MATRTRNQVVAFAVLGHLTVLGVRPPRNGEPMAAVFAPRILISCLRHSHQALKSIRSWMLLGHRAVTNP